MGGERVMFKVILWRRVHQTSGKTGVLDARIKAQNGKER